MPHPVEEAVFALAATGSQVTQFTVKSVTADVISLDYNTLPGNNPSQYGNTVFIWQNQNEIPWAQKPLNSQPITGGSQAGSIGFSGLNVSVNSYIIGYGVGPDVSSICSTAFVPALPDSNYQYFQTNLSNLVLGSTSLTVTFETPIGYTPATNKNWVGLWRGTTASYTRTPDVGSVQITLDGNLGTAAINNVNLGRGLTYTLAYFMGPKQSAMATTLTFTVGG